MTSTANSPWRPLRERIAGRTGERTLVEGTPAYMIQPLQEWVEKVLTNAGAFSLPDPGTHLHLRLRSDDIVHTAARRRFVSVTGMELLEVIDALMNLYSFLLEPGPNTTAKQWWTLRSADLRFMLEDGGSAWMPKDDFSGLTRRVDETVTEAARATIQAAPPDAAGHLRQAWDAAYGFHPDATKAYSEAVKAVEAVVIPHTIPTDTMATLGKAKNHIKDTRAKWSIAVDQKGKPAPVDALLALLELVWHGQSDRHAGPNTSPVTLESAQTALHAAVTVVQWFTAGAVKKTP